MPLEFTQKTKTNCTTFIIKLPNLAKFVNKIMFQIKINECACNQYCFKRFNVSVKG